MGTVCEEASSRFHPFIFFGPVELFSGFRVLGLGLGFRVSGSRFRVSGSKSVFKESSIGHRNYLSKVHVTQTIIT